jgi:hypothetical protein
VRRSIDERSPVRRSQASTYLARVPASTAWRQVRAGRLLVPGQCFEIVAHVLFVVGRRIAAFAVGVGRPEARRVRGQRFIDQMQRAGSIDAELEFGVGNDDAARRRVLGGGAVQGDGRVARLRRDRLGALAGRSQQVGERRAQSACARSKETFSS